MDNFEKNLRNKIEQAELEPSSNLWEHISAQIPQKEQKRRAFWLFWFIPIGFGLMILGYHYFTGNNQPVLPINSLKNNIRNDIVQIPLKTDQNNPPLNLSRGNTSYYHSMNVNTHSNLNSHVQLPVIFSDDDQFQLNTSLDQMALLQLNQLNSNNQNQLNSNIALSKYQLPVQENPTHLPQKKSNNKPFRFIIESVNSVYYSNRILKSTATANAEEKAYVNLRNKIEYGNIDYSGGIAFKVFLNKNFVIGTGIRMTHFSEDLIYNKADVFIAFNASPISIDGKIVAKYPLTFKNQTDSIFPGQTYYGGTNNYFFREIPLTFGYFNYGKTFNWSIEPAISFCKLTAIKASLLDLDHVGFTTINQPEGYSGVSGFFNASLRTHLGYNITRSFSINCGLSASRGISPLIKYGFAKQTPYTMGLSIGFEKRF